MYDHRLEFLPLFKNTYISNNTSSTVQTKLYCTGQQTPTIKVSSTRIGSSKSLLTCTAGTAVLDLDLVFDTVAIQTAAPAAMYTSRSSS